MTEIHIQKQIDQCRTTAQAFGEEALVAFIVGDVGRARTTARQAAQYARVVVQLETGEGQGEPEPASGARSAAGA